jgi:hypothetical protein
MTKKIKNSDFKSIEKITSNIMNEISEEIDAVRVYQSIQFDKKNETHFSTRNLAKKQVKIEFHNTLSAIKITSTTDCVIVPLTNVSAIYLKSPIKQEAIKEAEEDKLAKEVIRKSQRDTTKRPI